MDQAMRRSLTFLLQLPWLAGQGYLNPLLFCLIGQRHSAKGAHAKLDHPKMAICASGLQDIALVFLSLVIFVLLSSNDRSW
jgi:hypothetical protein